MRVICLLFLALLMVQESYSQELNCRVQVVAPTVGNVERRVLDGLRDAIRDFMNERVWTNDSFKFDERIECNLLLTIDNVTNNTRFNGQLQVQSNRIVYNSNYDSPMLNFIDEDMDFDYLENTIIEFQLDQHRGNLSSVLAFYAYLIIGMDYDSFAPRGGSEHFAKAQQIVVNAQNSNDAGWKAFESNKNRYWIMDNLLNAAFEPLRDCMYTYHMKGMDMMYENPNQARVKITEAISGLRKVHQTRPLSYNMRIFFLAKADELINVFSEAPQQEQVALFNDLQVLDPANISKYNKLKQRE